MYPWLITNAVDAICVVFVSNAAVGTTDVPVNLNVPLISTSLFIETSPDINNFPLTSNVRVGADFPIPTFPVPVILINSVPAA